MRAACEYGETKMIVLKYVGEGQYVVGVPATDLTREQIDASGYTVEQLLKFHSGAVYIYEAVNNGQ